MSAIRYAVAGVGSTPGIEHVDTGRCEAGRHRGGEELARDAGVTRDDGGETLACGLASLGRTALAQDDCCRLGQGECEIGGEGAVGQPPHPVRAEERHAERRADQRFEY